MTGRIAEMGIYFTYSFDPKIHDRFIETDEWQIILGRDLDMYYPPEPGLANIPPGKRARACKIIAIRRGLFTS